MEEYFHSPRRAGASEYIANDGRRTRASAYSPLTVSGPIAPLTEVGHPSSICFSVNYVGIALFYEDDLVLRLSHSCCHDSIENRVCRHH